jgi:hypothetical protein
MLVQSMVVVWYALSGYHPDDVTDRRHAEPWYDTKNRTLIRRHAPQTPQDRDRRKGFRRSAQVKPTPIHYATTPWPAPQAPHNYKTLVVLVDSH